MKNENITIYNFSNSFCELKGFSECFKSYANEFSGEYVIDGGIGFNANSGYVYIALENGVTICSLLGRDAQFLVSNPEGEEVFFDHSENALEFIEKLHQLQCPK